MPRLLRGAAAAASSPLRSAARMAASHTARQLDQDLRSWRKGQTALLSRQARCAPAMGPSAACCAAATRLASSASSQASAAARSANTGPGDAGSTSTAATAATANFNTEHSWPQSKGAQADPAMSDIHHLFPSDASANSERSNLPFGVVVTPSWTSADPDGDGDVSKRGLDANNKMVFEPRNAKKGDIARALFYFYVRYKSRPTPGFTLENFTAEEATLIQWAANDPPDAFERQRNALAFRAQGNRNPFIDRPEFVAAIGDFPNN